MKLGINGFGRIGRLVLRAAIEKRLEVTGINDAVTPIEQMVYLFQFDSIHGKFRGEVGIEGQSIVIHHGNQMMKVAVFSESDPKDIEWESADVNIIIETTGLFITLHAASRHLTSQAVKRVIITAPSPDIPMIIMGVNHDAYWPDQHRVLSAATGTSYCLAPLLKVLHEEYGVVQGFANIIHALEANQLVLDGPVRKNWRDGRGGIQNTIPFTTQSASEISKIIPALHRKVSARAFHVPIADVSCLDLTVLLEKETTMTALNSLIKQKSETDELGGIIGYTDQQVVSSDFIGDRRSCVYDSLASKMINEKMVNVIAWYDNEYAYAHRVVDLVQYISQDEGEDDDD